MADDWNETTLAEVSSEVSYGYTESASKERIGPHFLRITDIQNGVVDWDTVPYCPISESDHEKYRLRDGDIVVARTGNSTGENYLFRGNEDVVFASYLIRFRVEQREADPAFVWYNLRSQRWWNFINSSKTGSAQAGANAKVLGYFPLNLPTLDEQKAIGGVLVALDDKIELNRRMNATLEAMASANFQSWFVDFDPVRAKLDGRQPVGIDPGTAALFPNEFEDSELGPIPRDSRVGKVEDLLTFNRSTVDPSEFRDELFAHYSLPAFDEGRVPKFELGDAIKSQKLVVPPDAVLLSKLNPHIPRIWLPDVSADNRALCSTEFLVAQPKRGASREFLFCLFTSGPFGSEYATLVTGTTGSHQRVKGESVLQLNIVIPPGALIERFSALAKPLFDKTSRNIRESATLAAIRDAVLPKLLSGEISCAAGGEAD
jgi:type I restriction enzyme, S subunit